NAYLTANNIGRNQVGFEKLNHLKPADDAQGVPCTVFRSDGKQSGKDRSDGNSDIGNKHQQCGKCAEEPGVFNSHQHQSPCIQNCHNTHNGEEACQITLDHRIDVIE